MVSQMEISRMLTTMSLKLLAEKIGKFCVELPYIKKWHERKRLLQALCILIISLHNGNTPVQVLSLTLTYTSILNFAACFHTTLHQ